MELLLGPAQPSPEATCADGDPARPGHKHACRLSPASWPALLVAGRSSGTVRALVRSDTLPRDTLVSLRAEVSPDSCRGAPRRGQDAQGRAESREAT